MASKSKSKIKKCGALNIPCHIKCFFTNCNKIKKDLKNNQFLDSNLSHLTSDNEKNKLALFNINKLPEPKL